MYRKPQRLPERHPPGQLVSQKARMRCNQIHDESGGCMYIPYVGPYLLVTFLIKATIFSKNTLENEYEDKGHGLWKRGSKRARKNQYTCTTQTSPAPVARSPNSRPVCARDALSQALLLTVFLSRQGSGRGVWTLSTAWYDVAPSMVFTNAYPGFKPKCNSRDSIVQISERYV